jgi:hypothetical protein
LRFALDRQEWDVEMKAASVAVPLDYSPEQLPLPEVTMPWAGSATTSDLGTVS